jgi:TolA-binding protein
MLVSAGLSLGFVSSAMAAGGLSISHMNDVTHLEIAGIGTNDYQVDKNKNLVELKINDLSADKVKELRAYKDRHISKIDVSQSASLDQSIVQIYLTTSAVEMFDYLTDSPPSLSVDFYFDDEKQEKLAKAEASKKKKENAAKSKSGEEQDIMNESEEDSIERKLASNEFIKKIENASILSDLDEGSKKQINDGADGKKGQKRPKKIYDIRDTLDIEVQKINFPLDIIIEAREKIFLKFPLLLNESEYLSSVLSRKVSYEIADKTDPETKDFLKAQKMFDENDFKKFFKSKKIFLKKYPKSRYTEMISFMGADALLQTYKKEKDPELFEEALKTYDALISKYPKSSLSERTYLLLSFLRMKEGKFLEASRNLKTYVERYQKSPLRDNIRLILAQSLLRTKQYKDAALIYEELMKSEATDVKEMATFEAGDVFLEKNDYKNAIKYYETALNNYPQAAKKFPNIYFNLGEAQFMIEDYRSSIQAFRTFLKEHPQHDFSSYAWTRMGEMLEIAEKNERVWRGFYNESIFRFNNDDGAQIAKAHLLYHDSKKSVPHKYGIYLDGFKELEKNIKLPHADDFIAFKVADSYFERGDFKKSADHLIEFFREKQIPLEAEKFHKRIGRSLLAMLNAEMTKGTPDSALLALRDYDDLWFKKSGLISFDYIKARIYENAGMYDLAEQYFNKYLKSAKEHNVLESSEKVPSKSIAELFLTKALLHNKKIPLAVENFKKINTAELNEEEMDHYFRLERDMSVLRKDLVKAIAHSQEIKTPSKKDIRLLASLHSEEGNYTEAVKIVDKYVNSYPLNEKEKFEVLKEKIGFLRASKDKDKYHSYLKKFYTEFKSSKNNFDKEKYDLGKIYAAEGNTKDAQDVWSSISEGSIWAKLAKETNDENEWNKKYNKYIERVPAMQSKQKESQ